MIFFVSLVECNTNSVQCFLNNACNDEYKQLKLEVSAIKQTLQLLDTIKTMQNDIESLEIGMRMRSEEINQLKEGFNLKNLKNINLQN